MGWAGMQGLVTHPERGSPARPSLLKNGLGFGACFRLVLFKGQCGAYTTV